MVIKFLAIVMVTLSQGLFPCNNNIMAMQLRTKVSGHQGQKGDLLAAEVEPAQAAKHQSKIVVLGD